MHDHEVNKFTCDEEFCDEQQFTNPYQGQREYGWEGPPDIILYFPYNNPEPGVDPNSCYTLNEGMAIEKNYVQPNPYGK